MAYRGGIWTEDEKNFVAEHCGDMPYTTIAEKIGRKPKSVKKYIQEVLGKSVSSYELGAEYSIKHSPIWKELKNQFTDEELKMFLYHWMRIYAQFKEDVLATEEMQIVDYVRLEILVNRLLTQQHQNMQEIFSLEKQIEAEQKVSPELRDLAKVQSLGDQIAMRRAAQQAISKDHKDLIKQKTEILDKMKGTREARIKMLESSKETLIGWIKLIINDATIRNRLGIQMEKMRLAMKHEENRLKQLHRYVDGNYDKPLLAWDTIDVQSTRNEDTSLQEDGSSSNSEV